MKNNCFLPYVVAILFGFLQCTPKTGAFRTVNHAFIEEGYRNEKGELDGVYKRYYKNGNLESVEYYKDGVNEGSTIAYHKNGKIRLRTNYKNGRIYGEYIEYFPNGKLYLRDYFNLEERDTLHRLFELYNERGDTVQIGYKRDGKFIREWTFFDYKNKVKEIKVYDSTGVLLSETKVPIVR